MLLSFPIKRFESERFQWNKKYFTSLHAKSLDSIDNTDLFAHGSITMSNILFLFAVRRLMRNHWTVSIAFRRQENFSRVLFNNKWANFVWTKTRIFITTSQWIRIRIGMSFVKALEKKLIRKINPNYEWEKLCHFINSLCYYDLNIVKFKEKKIF